MNKVMASGTNHSATRHRHHHGHLDHEVSNGFMHYPDQDETKRIFVNVNGGVQEILFSTGCSNADLQNMLKQVAKVSPDERKENTILLKTHDGAFVTVASTMPTNSASKPYSIQKVRFSRVDDCDREKQLNELIKREMKRRNQLCDFEDSMKGFVQRLHSSWMMPSDFAALILKRISRLEASITAAVDKTVRLRDLEREVSDLRAEVRSLGNHENVQILTSYDENGNVKIQQIHYDLLNYDKYTISQQTIENLRQPTFDIWRWQNNEMLSLLEFIFQDLGLMEEFQTNSKTVKQWLLCVKAHYKSNPFHNFRHSFCVAQMMYAMIHCCELAYLLPRERLGVLLIASICHDLDHTGFNNKYQIEAKTDLALRYHNISPLENHHYAVATAILDQEETNLFANLSEERVRKLRGIMRIMILATDMSRHKEILDEFRQYIQSGFDYKNTVHVDVLSMILIKCCDISNEVRPQNLSEPWVDALLEEYSNQGAIERKQGFEVDPLMDDRLTTKSKAQLKFIKQVILPMFELASQLHPQVRVCMMAPLVDALRRYERSSIEEEELNDDY